MVNKLCKLSGCILCWRAWARGKRFEDWGWKSLCTKKGCEGWEDKGDMAKAVWGRNIWGARVVLVELHLGRMWPWLARLKAWKWGGSERVVVLSYYNGIGTVVSVDERIKKFTYQSLGWALLAWVVRTGHHWWCKCNLNCSGFNTSPGGHKGNLIPG